MSIHNPWENDFVKQLNLNTNGWQAWIGLKKEDRMDWQNDTGELIRSWTDGTKSKYQSWGPNEPSNINIAIDVSIYHIKSIKASYHFIRTVFILYYTKLYFTTLQKRENCAEIDGSGQWNDDDCTLDRDFICASQRNVSVMITITGKNYRKIYYCK